VPVLRPELDAPGMIRPGPAALRAGGGQLLIPPDPAIAVIGKVSHTFCLPHGADRRPGRDAAGDLHSGHRPVLACPGLKRDGDQRGTPPHR
jgi:hypothetical protein